MLAGCKIQQRIVDVRKTCNSSVNNVPLSKVYYCSGTGLDQAYEFMSNVIRNRHSFDSYHMPALRKGKFTRKSGTVPRNKHNNIQPYLTLVDAIAELDRLSDGSTLVVTFWKEFIDRSVSGTVTERCRLLSEINYYDDTLSPIGNSTSFDKVITKSVCANCATTFVLRKFDHELISEAHKEVEQYVDMVGQWSTIPRTTKPHNNFFPHKLVYFQITLEFSIGVLKHVNQEIYDACHGYASVKIKNDTRLFIEVESIQQIKMLKIMLTPVINHLQWSISSTTYGCRLIDDVIEQILNKDNTDEEPIPIMAT